LGKGAVVARLIPDKSRGESLWHGNLVVLRGSMLDLSEVRCGP
jgi:hypothetical protein